MTSTLHIIRFKNKKELAETKQIWKEFQRESSHEDTWTFFVQLFSLLLVHSLQSYKQAVKLSMCKAQLKFALKCTEKLRVGVIVYFKVDFLFILYSILSLLRTNLRHWNNTNTKWEWLEPWLWNIYGDMQQLKPCQKVYLLLG